MADPVATNGSTQLVDRRRFIERVGLGAAAGGALWVAPQTLGWR